MLETPATKPTNNRAKGKRIVSLAKQVLEAKGALVCQAPLQARWIGKGKFISLASDYFGLFDLIAVWPDGSTRTFVQVTTAEHANDRRHKIVASGFPCTGADLILGYVEGQGRKFRVYRGPDFLTEESEYWDIAEPDKEPVA